MDKSELHCGDCGTDYQSDGRPPRLWNYAPEMDNFCATHWKERFATDREQDSTDEWKYGTLPLLTEQLTLIERWERENPSSTTTA